MKNVNEFGEDFSFFLPKSETNLQRKGQRKMKTKTDKLKKYTVDRDQDFDLCNLDCAQTVR